jgi:hypothetical protein
MLTKPQARAIAAAHVLRQSELHGSSFVLFDDETRAEDFGWVFFWNTAKFSNTGDDRWCAAGCSPIIIDAEDGHVYSCETLLSVEFHVDWYRRHRADKPKGYKPAT